MVTSILGLFQSFIPGLRLVDGGEIAQLVNILTGSQSGVKATVGGTNLTSTPLLAAFVEIDTSTNTNTDGVVLPNAIPGSEVIVFNASGNTVKVFASAANPNNPSVTGASQADQLIDNASTALVLGATGVLVTSGVLTVFACFKAGIWKKAVSN